MNMPILYLKPTRLVRFFTMYCVNSLKQHSTGDHVSPHEHILLILSQSFVALSPQHFVLSGEAAYVNIIVCNWTR